MDNLKTLEADLSDEALKLAEDAAEEIRRQEDAALIEELKKILLAERKAKREKNK